MQVNPLFIANSALLGLGLAMDAFSVCLCNGLNESNMKAKRMTLIALVFAFFQALMPLLGWFFIHSLADHFMSFRIYIPWIAFIILFLLGLNMIREGRESKEEEACQDLSGRNLFLQGIATSIDALSAGLTMAEYKFPLALFAATIIAFITFFLCIFGLQIGKKFGARLKGGASTLGGTILIFIGGEILIKGLI